jgi:hypothetical protein
MSDTTEFQREVRALIEANRARALWSWPLDYFPDNPESTRRALERIAARGDRATYIRARELLQQLD